MLSIHSRSAIAYKITIGAYYSYKLYIYIIHIFMYIIVINKNKTEQFVKIMFCEENIPKTKYD